MQQKNSGTTKKHLAVITGTRAEYGLLRPVIQKLLKSDKIIPEVIATGAHLSPEYGHTVDEIRADGIPLAAELDILKFEHGPLALADTVAYTIQQFARWFTENRPDAVLVLGDRYEIFAAAQAAAITGVPIAHISGGDVTRGAADDYYRHCITKMAALHFPSCAAYARRVVRMGENPADVYNVGGLGDENIRTMPKMALEELSESIGFDLHAPYALVTYHPETAGEADPAAQSDALLGAMDAVGHKTRLHWLITKANADTGGEIINRRLDAWAAARPGQAVVFASLGVKRYLSAMQHAAAVVGNSSSGVVETPTFGVPTVNIGSRQAGRIVCQNVLCCAARQKEIEAALQTALTPEFTARAHQTVSPYYGGDTSGRIVAILEERLFAPGFGAPKGFYDGPTDGEA
ncbi:MAG: UDP-N-acetylglucosamine 2-epimerase [Faecalibacterium sp.]|jgi:GDP/UDP-N,N'-diacetylbacillosamine 2-epimerase (hydrolysing)|nr:UDP-N-acetylglucosamine 2-epimerase [Faecalibacterium sp.]